MHFTLVQTNSITDKANNMKSNIPKYQIKQNLLQAMGNPLKCSKLVFALKNIECYNTIIDIVTEITRTTPTLEKRFWGNMLPKTINDLGKESVYFYKPRSLRSEINWIILGVKRNLNIINKFIIYKDDFEHKVLLGKYEDGLEILDKIEKEIGSSIWFYESKFIVYEMMGAQDKSITLISQINKAKQNKGEDNGYITLLLYYLWNRSKKDLSAIKYDEDLHNRFKKNITDFQKDTYSYHLFRLNYYINYNIENISIPLIMEAPNSIIDRYIVLIQVLKSSVVKKEYIDTVISRSRYLYKLTNDISLLPLLYLKTPQVLPNENYFNKDYIKIVDSYYKGDYSNVLNQCKQYIKSDTTNFEVYKLFCYSLLMAGNGYSPIYSELGSPVNQICRKIYDTICEKDNTASLYNLYQLNKNLYGFSIAAGLDSFIKKENNENESNLMKLLSKKCFDPYYSTLYNDEDKAIEYLKTGLNNIGNSVSIEQQIRRIKKQITPSGIIVDYIAKEDNARILFVNEEYEAAYLAWMEILEKNRHSNPICQTAIKFAFDCLVKLEKYQTAISLYVDEYISNPITVKKTGVDSFLLFLKTQRYKNIKRTIELPIFVGLNSPKSTDKSFILKSFCTYYDVKKPSELFELLNNVTYEKIETLFSVIVTEDILRHYSEIKSTQESLEEKQKILSFLISLKTERENLYRKMEDEILEELILYNGTKKMDESKIFANDQAIIKYELTDIQGLYDSFNVQYNLLESGTFLFVDTASFSNAEPIDGAILKARIKYTDNAIYQVAYALYDTIRDKFLFSKFGLGTYLSTRIRHGVLEGELRSDFLENNLVLNKSNDKYVANSYWVQTYGLSESSNKALYQYLAEFSKEVDNLISNFKLEVLQIKIDQEAVGYFNYYIDPETLSIEALRMAYKSNDSQEFCQLIIRNLWEITERNLNDIRSYIKNDFAEKFHILFDNLINKVSLIQSTHFKNDITRCINDVRATLGQKLLKIEGWFHIQESKFDDFNLQDLINISWESTRKFYPQKNLECQLNIQGANLIVKAIYGIHFSDILRILLTNMFKYSSSVPFSNKMNSQITTTIQDDIMMVSFENDIQQNEDELNERFKYLMDSQGRLQKEGGSGLVKAQKIVKYDLDDIENYVKISAKDQKCVAVVRINLKNLIVQ